MQYGTLFSGQNAELLYHKKQLQSKDIHGCFTSPKSFMGNTDSHW